MRAVTHNLGNPAEGNNAAHQGDRASHGVGKCAASNPQDVTGSMKKCAFTNRRNASAPWHVVGHSADKEAVMSKSLMGAIAAAGLVAGTIAVSAQGTQSPGGGSAPAEKMDRGSPREERGDSAARRPEGIASTGRPEGIASTGRPEGIASTGRPEGIASTGRPEGDPSAGRPESSASAGRPEGGSSAGRPEGGSSAGRRDTGGQNRGSWGRAFDGTAD